MNMNPKQGYVRNYYSDYDGGKVDDEIRAVGIFLSEQVKGRALDCGCGPVPQLWSIFMNQMTELHAVDLPQESVDFVNEKLKSDDWYKEFSSYQKILEEKVGSLPDEYIATQVHKLKSIKQADMSKDLPFDDDYFDTVMSLYSLGCLSSEEELSNAIKNVHRVLKTGGTLIHINTDGTNSNSILPAYTWNGLEQDAETLKKYLKEVGLGDITEREVVLDKDIYGNYRYNKLLFLTAVKK